MMDLFNLRHRGDRISSSLELAFFLSSTIFNYLSASKALPILGWLYLTFLLLCLLNWSQMRPPRGFTMYRYPISIFNFFIYVTILLSRLTYAQSPDKDTTSIQSAAGATPAPPLPSHASSEVIEISGTITTFRPIFTVPTEADVGAPLLPNINDPNATDAQTTCPGYNATNVKRTAYA